MTVCVVKVQEISLNRLSLGISDLCRGYLITDDGVCREHRFEGVVVALDLI